MSETPIIDAAETMRDVRIALYGYNQGLADGKTISQQLITELVEAATLTLHGCDNCWHKSMASDETVVNCETSGHMELRRALNAAANLLDSAVRKAQGEG